MEVVLEGAVTVVAEVTLPHGHLHQVPPMPGKPQNTQVERGGNTPQSPRHTSPTERSLSARPVLCEEGSPHFKLMTTREELHWLMIMA